MARRWLLVGLGGALATALTVGVALAGARPAPAAPAQGTPTESQGLAAACAAMHDSPAMRELRAQLPPQTRAQMDRMHAQMQPLMNDTSDLAGMMNGMGRASPMMGAMR